jgi:hypothetical protein
MRHACRAALMMRRMKHDRQRMPASVGPVGTVLPPSTGGRRHRFMESSDFNAVFRELFDALRANVRRGMTCEGQTYAVEMDTFVPGEMLAATWLPPSAQGVGSLVQLYDARRRRTLYDRLLAQPGADSLFAYVCERARGVYLEVVGEDAAHAATFPVRRGRGWHRRELVRVRHGRIDLRALDGSR